MHIWRVIGMAALAAAIGCEQDSGSIHGTNSSVTSGPAPGGTFGPGGGTGSGGGTGGADTGGTTAPPPSWNEPSAAPASDAPLVAYTSRQALSDALASVPATNPVYYPMPATTQSGGVGPVSPSAPNAGPSAGPTAGPSGAAAASSSTTVQEQGVDEADAVKHDGRYLYVCAGNRVRVVDTRPLAATAQVAQCTVEGTATGCYLVDGLLVVLSNWVDTAPSMGGAFQTGTAVTVFDVRDPEAPVEIGARYFDGWLQASRVIADRLCLVQQHFAVFTPTMTADDRVDAYLPNVRQSPTDAGLDVLGATQVYHPRTDVQPWNTLLTVSMLDVHDVRGPVTAIGAAVASGFTTYVSLGACYLTHGSSVNGAVATMFHKLRLTAQGPGYVGSGTALGTVLNPYSCGEHAGYLRVATRVFAFSNEFWFGGTPSTTVTVLGENGGRLDTVGTVTDIEPGESLNTARFLGDRGYLITSVQAVDPLFTLDLSDPANPAVMGEFTYDGVADFLYPVSADRLLAVGRQSIDGRFDGVQCSLFDVSDLTNPTRVSVWNVAGAGASTDVRFDPHAFTWYASHGQFSLPLRAWNTAGTFGQNTTLAVGAIQNDRLVSLGSLTFASATYYGALALRGVFLDDDVLGVAPDRVVGNAVASLGGGQITVILP